ncbi:MAG: hypothetical protein AAGA48_10705 [Myxococcota bacterium]
MPSLADRWKALRKAMAERAAKRTWTKTVERARSALAAATKPLQTFADAERQRFEAARRRWHARETQGEATAAPAADESDDPR